MTERDTMLLKKIAKYIHEAQGLIQGISYENFKRDSKTMYAAAFVLGQIGELAKEISIDTISMYPHIPWKGMRGMRNRIVHDYENIDLAMLWDVLADDLPKLLSQINALLS